MIAATSFHWIDPAVASVKCAAVLKPAGSLAVFWNTAVGRDEGFFLRVQDAYRAHAPAMAGTEAYRDEYYKEPASLEFFGAPVERRYQWAVEYSAREYIRLLGTYSDHINLPDKERHNLFSAIEAMIEGEFGGKVLKHYEMTLRIQSKRLIPSRE